MAKYYYSKYNVVMQTYYQMTVGAKTSFGVDQHRDVYSSYSFNDQTGLFTISGSLVHVGPYEGQGRLGYSKHFDGSNNIIRFTHSGVMNTKVYWEVLGASSVSTPLRGSLVQSNMVAEDGTYPANGRHTDGYWYVRGVLAFPEFQMKINGLLKTSEAGWVKVGGALREIDTITVKVNNILREV